MLIELTRLVGAALVAVVAVSTLRVVFDLLLNGEGRVREVREQGGGMVAKFRGELDRTHRRSTSARAHGLHIEIDRAGDVVFRDKSTISKEVA